MMIREIREYTPGDAAAVAAMFNEWDSVWPGGWTDGVPYTAERVREDVRQRRLIAGFLAVADGRVVGLCALEEFSPEPGVAYVDTLGVSPTHHKQGFGRDLLRRALDRTIELGYGRLDLHTWEGNLRAVPLYKKSGYFWVPETRVWMQNYLPTILRLDYVREFLGGADWYGCFRRDLDVRPDEHLEAGMKVFPYEFEREGRRLRVLVDPRARGITAVETERFAVGCRVSGERFALGLPVPLVWQVTNRQPEAGPLEAMLVARGEEGVALRLQARLGVVEAETLRAEARPERDARERPDEAPAHRVWTTAIVGGAAVELATGLALCQPVDVSVEGGCIYLEPGVPRAVTFTLRSEVDAPVAVRVRLTAPPEVELAAAAFEVSLPPRGLGGLTTRATATGEGAFVLRTHLTLTTPSATLEPKPAEIAVHSVGPGGVVASFDERRALLTTAQLRVAVRRRGAGVDVFDAPSGARLGRSWAVLGPPFEPSEFASRDFAVELERRPGSVVATLSSASTTRPGVVFERKLALAPGPALRLWHRAVNGSETTHALQVYTRLGCGPGGGALAVPLTAGLVVDAAPDFPDWRDPRFERPEAFAESWVAGERDGLVGGCVWEQAATVGVSPEGVALTLDLGEVGPARAADSPATWLYAGSGDWRATRRFWRAALRPDAPAEAAPPRRALDARITPALTLGGDVALELRSLRGRALAGQVELELPAELEARPARLDFAGLEFGEPWRGPIRLAFPPGGPPRAYAGQARVDAGVWQFDFPLTVIRAGLVGATVRVREERVEGLTVLTIENGHLTLRASPDFAGSLVELSAGGVNHLLSAFPRAGVFSWMNPWHGGFEPSRFEPAARFTAWRAASREDASGLRWEGVLLAAELEQRGLRGLRLEVEYLTLGGSNLVAIATRLVNPTGAALSGEHGGRLFLAPGGERAGALAHLDRGGDHRRRPRGGLEGARGRWAAVENPVSGDALAIVAAQESTVLSVDDLAAEGIHLGFGPSRREIEPRSASEAMVYLALARGAEQARLYRALGC